MECVHDQMPRQRVDPFRTHRVALVRHGRGADLLFLERLFDLAQVLQQAHVVGELRRRLRETGERIHHLRIDLA
jgi:hypothetical protein